MAENKDYGIQSHHFKKIDGETMEIVTDFILGGPKSLQMVTAAMKLCAELTGPVPGLFQTT